MGGEIFKDKATGLTMTDAFNVAVAQAAYYHGHGGYTGTIAEKDSFTDLTSICPVDAEGRKAFIDEAVDDGAANEKWGPCGGVEVTDQKTLDRWFNDLPPDHKGFVFFGWASS